MSRLLSRLVGPIWRLARSGLRTTFRFLGVLFHTIMCWARIVLRATFRFDILYSPWITSQPIHFALLAAVWLIGLGFVGQGFGLDNLFWHEDPRVQFIAGFSLVSFALLLWTLGALRHPNPGRRVARARLVLGPGTPFPKGRENQSPCPPDPSETLDSPTAGLRLVLHAMAIPLVATLVIAWLIRSIVPPIDSMVSDGVFNRPLLAMVAWGWMPGIVRFLTILGASLTQFASLIFSLVWLPLGAIAATALVDVSLGVLARRG